MIMKNICADGMREKLTSLMPYRIVTAEKLPSKSAVVTSPRYLKEALLYYEENNEGEIPIFLITGALDEDQLPLNHKHQIHEFSTIDLFNVRHVCVYGKHFGAPDSPSFLAQKGIDTYFIAQPLHDYLKNWWYRTPYPEHIERRMEEIAKIHNLLADESSRNIFTGAIKSIQTGEASHLPVSPFLHYFHPKLEYAKGDIVFEGGVAGGNITRAISTSIGPHGQLIGFEPLKSFYEAALTKTQDLDNVHLEPAGLWSCTKDFFLQKAGNESKIVETSSSDTEPCKVIDIDSYVTDKNVRCDAIKLDIEGAELECLKGARKTIQKYHPKLMISIYHHSYDYIDIPLWIADNFPGYEFYLGHHSLWHHETCLYAIHPDGRHG